MNDTVNLATNDTAAARKSRNWLVDRIHEFPEQNSTFPSLYNEIDIAFGSFARRTKIRPLDDVDQIIGMMGEGATYTDTGYRLEITIPEGSSSNLARYLHAESRLLNSRRIINAFVSEAANVPQYEHAEIKRTGEAATLDLSSYDWTFDIVPAFITSPESNGCTYYVIPDGHGHWKRTDPRLDRDRVTEVNQNHDGKMLDAIRIMKYWNGRRTAPVVRPYLFENLIVNYYANQGNSRASDYVDLEVLRLLPYLASAVHRPVDDPKDIQGNLNDLTLEERNDVAQQASDDARIASYGRRLECDGDHRGAIREWRKVFGDGFPEYG